MAGRFDEMYMTICKEVGGIEGLFNSFFDFMFRKTDFFYECDPGDSRGFPPGVNTRIVFNAFKHFQDEHYKKFPKKDPKEYEEKLIKYREQQQKKAEKKAEYTEKKTEKVYVKAETTKVELVKAYTYQPKVYVVKPKYLEAQKTEATIINTYNGGDSGKYKWSQDQNDVVVTMEIPTGTVASELKVELKIQHIKISLKKDGTVLLDGDLFEKILVGIGYSTWTIENSGKKTFIVLHLAKAYYRIWSTILKGDKEIDTTKVDNSKPLHDFDDETQGALRKIMYEQQRKMQGLPTTEEEKQIEALKKAWDAEGSPFKGTPFDPSKFNLPNVG